LMDFFLFYNPLREIILRLAIACLFIDNPYKKLYYP